MLRLGYLTLAVVLGSQLSPVTALGGEAAAEKSESEEPEIPPVEVTSLRTTDGVALSLRYYPGTEGRESVPVIILHGWKGDATEYDDLALYLQSRGHAVAVPDLRGHGDSTAITSSTGVVQKKLDPDRLGARDVQKMVRYDIEAVKAFLLEKNNAEQLNIEKLCVIGVEFGTLLALNWSVVDWSWPDLAALKQGKDVKALALISPEASLRGLSVKPPLNHPAVQSQLSMLIVVGDEGKRHLSYAKRVHGSLIRYHPEPPPEQVQKLKKLFLIKHPTSLQGLKLLEAKEEFKTFPIIAGFIKARLVDKKFPWTKRERP